MKWPPLLKVSMSSRTSGGGSFEWGTFAPQRLSAVLPLSKVPLFLPENFGVFSPRQLRGPSAEMKRWKFDRIFAIGAEKSDDTLAR